MEQRLSLQKKRRPYFLSFLTNLPLFTEPEIEHWLYSTPSFVPILSQMIPGDDLPLYSRHIRHQRLSLQNGVFLSGFPAQNPVRITLLPAHATQPTPINFLDSNNRIVFGEKWQSLSSSFTIFYPASWQFLPFGPKHLFQDLTKNALRLFFTIHVRQYDSHPYKAQFHLCVF